LKHLAISVFAGSLFAGSTLPAAASRLGTQPGAALTGYRLVDYGNPTKAGFGDSEAAVGFNNTGQIVGYANSQFQLYNLQAGAACIAYTGTKFVNTAVDDDYGCFPSASVTDVSGGTFETVGTIRTFYSATGAVPFVAMISGNNVATTHFDSNFGAALLALNRRGYSVGYSLYYPPLGFFTAQPPFYSHGNVMSPLQPQCTTRQLYCMSAIATTNGRTGGARAINASYTVVGGDAMSGDVMEYTIGKPSSGIDFPAITASTAHSLLQIIGLDDAGNVYTWAQEAAGQRVYTYNVATGKYLSIGTPLGADCNYQPLSVNASGEVLGYVHGGLTNLFDYFTWSASGGFKRLNDPSTSSIVPVQVNDEGDLLVNDYTAKGSYEPDWEIEYPTASASKGIR
jgi:hypothetical protein